MSISNRIPTLGTADQPHWDRQLQVDIEAALPVIDKARAQLGDNLDGGSVVDLLADNFCWPLSWCRKVANAIAIVRVPS